MHSGWLEGPDIWELLWMPNLSTQIRELLSVGHHVPNANHHLTIFPQWLDRMEYHINIFYPSTPIKKHQKHAGFPVFRSVTFNPLSDFAASSCASHPFCCQLPWLRQFNISEGISPPIHHIPMIPTGITLASPKIFRNLTPKSHGLLSFPPLKWQPSIVVFS